MILLKFIIDIICAVLNSWGGFNFHNARRYFMPVVLGIGISIVSNCWWLGLTILPTMGLLSIGYGDNSILKKIFGDAWARFFWMSLVCIGFSLELTLTHKVNPIVTCIYVLGAGVLGMTLRKINQIIGDIIFGMWFGIILFFING